MRRETAQDPADYPGSVEGVYAWLRRHPWLVDGTLAVVLLAGAANAYLLDAAVLPASLALAGTVAVRRRFPVWAYAVALAIGTAQVVVGIGPTFTELRSSLASVRGVIDTVDTGVSSLYPVADRVQAALTSLRSLNASLSPAVAALQHPVSSLVPWVGQLNQVSDRLQPIATALLPQVPTVDRLAQRLVDCQKGVIGFFQWDTSLTKFGDQNGPEPRGNLAFGVPAIGLPGEPLRTPERGCTPGLPVRGVPTPGDLH